VVGGCSAGGLAVLLNIDAVRALLPPSARVRALADAGYFLDSPDKYSIYLYPCCDAVVGSWFRTVIA
jgi:hypothetical protein